VKSLPQELINSLRSLPGFNEEEFTLAHDPATKLTSIRLNPFKKAEFDFELNSPVKWCSNAFYLNDRPFFTHDPLFHAGCYYVQEAGSMFLEHALKSTLDFSAPLKILDLCGAPGGKSTLINSLLNEESILVANEVIKQRSDVLVQNLSKWGTFNTIVTNNDPQKFSQIHSCFDAIIIDAPCSGSGLFRKQPEAIDQWSIDNVNLCSARQKRILADVLPSLKEGGFLYYSTCSYSIQENEGIVNWLVAEFEMEYVPLDLQKDWGIIETPSGYRFYPHLTPSEGFFCAVLKKKEGSQSFSKFIKSKEQALSKGELEVLSTFANPAGARFIKKNSIYHLCNETVLQFISDFGKNLYFKKAGVAMGEIKGKDFVPAQELAWCNYLKSENKIDLDRINSLKYLRKETFSVPDQNPGISLISYKKQGLGWAKVLPGRINNYLPNELRILN